MKGMEEFEELVKSMIRGEPGEWQSYSAEYEGGPLDPYNGTARPSYVRLDIEPSESMPGRRLTFECGEKFTKLGEPWVEPKAFFDGLWDPAERKILAIDFMTTDSAVQDVKSMFCSAVRSFLEMRNLYEVRSEYGW